MTRKVYRSLAALLLVMAFSLAGVQPALAAAPANDNFADAQVVPALPFSTLVDITDATAEPNEPDYCDTARQTVWYSFTPSELAAVSVSIQNTNPDVYSYLAVFRADGEGFPGLQLLACGSPSDPGIFLAEPGYTYYLQALPALSAPGALQIDMNIYPAPENDTFANALSIDTLDFAVDIDTTGALYEAGEPIGSCAYTPAPWPFRTVWLKYTATQDGLLSPSVGSGNDHFLAVYQGSGLSDLTELGCQPPWGSQLAFSASAGETYYFQIGGVWGGYASFYLQNTPPPIVYFTYDPPFPSKYDTIQFSEFAIDPAELGFQSFTWDFGDGTTSTEQHPTHHYTADGDYTIQHTATTVDGRTASTTVTISVRTHDVAITKIEVPKSARSGRTREITVSVRNIVQPEWVRISLYRYTPEIGYEEVGYLVQYVPARARTTEFIFNYNFSPQDAAAGQITFKAVAYLDYPDARPADNELTSSPILVRP
jgi:hypothetical protein